VLVPPQTLGIALHPTFDGSSFTILLLMSILRCDELRLQHQHPAFPGFDDHRQNSVMDIQGLAIGQFLAAAVRAMDLLRGERACPVAGNQDLIGIAAKRIQLTADFYRLQPFGKDPVQHFRRLRIQQIADLVVTRNALGAKDALWTLLQPFCSAIIRWYARKELDCVKKMPKALTAASLISYCVFSPRRKSGSRSKLRRTVRPSVRRISNRWRAS
jgi:hypothetical protein